jgi:hypothetical protein
MRAFEKKEKGWQVGPFLEGFKPASIFSLMIRLNKFNLKRDFQIILIDLWFIEIISVIIAASMS